MIIEKIPKIGIVRRDSIKRLGKVIVVGQAEEGWSNPDVVKVMFDNAEYIGYLKKTSVIGKKSEIEIALFQLGGLLDVSMADIICIYEDDKRECVDAIVSLSVVQSTENKFVNFREIKDELFLDLQKGEILHTPWIRRWEKIRERKKTLKSYDVPAILKRDYADTVSFAMEVGGLYCKKYGYVLMEFKNDYLKMLLFDILCGQADRSSSNYGVIINPVFGTARLAPLYDNATLYKPYMNINQMGLNHMILDRKEAFFTIYDLYPEEVQKMLAGFLAKKENVFGVIKNNIYISDDTKKCLVKTIEKGFGIFDQLM